MNKLEELKEWCGEYVHCIEIDYYKVHYIFMYNSKLYVMEKRIWYSPPERMFLFELDFIYNNNYNDKFGDIYRACIIKPWK